MKYCPQCRSELSVNTIDRYERKICTVETCGFIYWDNPSTVVLALVQVGNKYVLARNSQWPAGVFSMISGFVESNETLEQAALREVKEELGLNASIKSYIGSYPFVKMKQLVVGFWVTAEGDITLDDEIAEVKFVSAQELRAYQFGKLKISRDVVIAWQAMASEAEDSD